MIVKTVVNCAGAWIIFGLAALAVLHEIDIRWYKNHPEDK